MGEISIEYELYEPVRNYLALNFSSILSRKAGAGQPAVFVDDVSSTPGTADGIWTRPDLAATAFAKGQFIPFFRADLHTFELKTASGLDVKGVHEANAHGKLGHYAWLVFQSVGRAARSSELYTRILSSANDLGVGVVTFNNATSADGWYVDSWPRRTETDDAVADRFIDDRFSVLQKKRVQDYLTSINASGASK